MKKLLTILCFMMFSVAIAQTPQAINYQAVATNSSGTPIANSQIGIRISILAGNATGTNVYTETHITTTSANGIFNVEIGRGSVQSGNFPNIQWYAQPHFAKIDIDVNGGTNYQTIGTTQFLSVPYALFAENVAMIFKVNDFIEDYSSNDIYTRNDTLYINQGKGYSATTGCVVEYLGGELEELSISTLGTNGYIYFKNTTFPQLFKPKNINDDCHYLRSDGVESSSTFFISATTPVGIYPITITATNPRGRQKNKTNYINVLPCNVSTENDFVGTYYGNIEFFVYISDTILITNPINNDNLVTINSSLLGNVVCTRTGNTFTGNFSNLNKTINFVGIGEVTVSNFSGQITGTLCNEILNVTISPTSGTATSSYGTLNLGTSKGTYEKQ